MDGILFIAPSSDTENIINNFNNYDANFQFTYKLEVECSPIFLDVSLTVEDSGFLVSSWYRKPTFSGSVLNIFSNHPLTLKKAMVFNLVDRAILLSNKIFHSTNLQIVTNILLAALYPPAIINSFICKRIRKLNF